MGSWSIVFAIGAAQAALLAAALWRRPINAQANRVLAVWIALIGIDLAVKAMYFNAPAAGLLKAFRFVGLFPFLYGSLFYVYVRALTQPTGTFREWSPFRLERPRTPVRRSQQRAM